jgi:hypothetical protein
MDLPPSEVKVLVSRGAVQLADGQAFVETPTSLGYRKVDVRVIGADEQFVAVEGLPTRTPVKAGLKQPP